MQDFDKLGSFYLGSEVNKNNDNSELVLYDSKDLTTHAVIIGMTGSGKTGLGICMIEEALLDGIPVIAVDPKGDLGNLLLTFPDLSESDIKPWIDEDEAKRENKSIEELAKEKAELWINGLKNTQQSTDRIKTLRDTVDMNLYTPGSTVGNPISLLRSLNAPNKKITDDKDLYRERISSATTGILSLLGVENDPLSREHILVNNILEFIWDKGQNIKLTDLITSIQTPPFTNIGVMDIETIYPQKDRLKLAMKLNNLLASPSFKAWTQGVPLDADSLLFNKNGKPQLSVMNIAHLSEEERIFFLTMLLNEILGWMRTQSGTSSLRAVLYIDDIFGYMPPVGNPATKTLLLTLLKQARAYGLGIVLSTQNPVDLDYKGLSNAGTWFIGKLQTEQDRNRVMGGLLSATESGFDKKELNEAFNQLGKRKFLMHNIHEESPIIMTTRWAMSYLAGPLSREQIKTLSKQGKDKDIEPEEKKVEVENVSKYEDTITVPNEIKQYFIPPKQIITDYSHLVYKPCLLAVVNIHYDDTKTNTHTAVDKVFTTEFETGAIAINWRNSTEDTFLPEKLGLEKPADSKYIQPIPAALKKEYYKDWEKSLSTNIRQENPLTLLVHEGLKMNSNAGESESEFRQRITQHLREARDEATEKLKESIGKKLNTLQTKLEKAELKVEKESSQSSSKTMDAILGAGTALFSAFLSRKKVSATNARRLSSALKKATGAFGERDDIKITKDAVQSIQSDIDELGKNFLAETELIKKQFDEKSAKFSELSLFPKSTGVHVKLFGLGWRPGIIDNDKWTEV